MILRDYQKECKNVVDNLNDGARTIVCLATGLGKTAVAANFDFKGRVLWLSHRDELVRQPERYFVERGMSFGIEKANEHAENEDVVSASVQSISRDNRLSKFDPNEFDVVICDEAQHAAAPSYRKVLDYFKPRKLVGLTATPKRGDGVGLDSIFHDICFVRDLQWGIKNGYLSKIRCVHIDSDYDMNSVKFNLGDFTASGLEDAMSSSDNDVIVAKAYLKHCVPQNKRTLIYCPTISVCNQVADTIKNVLPEEDRNTVAVLSDKVSADKRKQILDDYIEGSVRCIVNCMILTEGTDLPSTEVIINNRPSANSSLYQQIVGRGTRLAEGKEYCLVIDILGKNYKAKNICTAPTLFGIDPDFLPEDARKELEDTDLLEAAETLASHNPETVMNARLIEQMVDIFTQQRISLITDYAKEGLRRIADRYREELEYESAMEVDFGDILARKTPDESKFYKIAATFDGCIYFSKPDMLNKVTVEFNIPNTEKSVPEMHFISERMDFNEARDFVYGYLRYIVPERYAFKWSKSGRERMAKAMITDRQVWRVQKEYDKYGIKDNTKSLTRLQASDLIDLTIEIHQQEERRDRIQKQIRDAEKKRNRRNLINWKEKMYNAEKVRQCVEKQKKNAYTQARKWIDEIVSERKKEQAKRIKAEDKKANQDNFFYLKSPASFYSGRKDATPKQRLFIKQLYDDIRGRGVLFNKVLDPYMLRLDSWQAGFLVEYLIHINKNTVSYHNYVVEYDLKNFLSIVIKSTQKDRPESVVCLYKMLKKGES